MIVATKQPSGYLASTWLAGIALVVFMVGVQGAVQPLLPRTTEPALVDHWGDEVLLAQFDSPASAAEEKPPEPMPVEQPDIEIPPLPAIVSPLTPPEMVELNPLETPAPERPQVMKSPSSKPKPQAETGRKMPPQNTGGGTQTGGVGAPALFTGGGSGRFPSPVYPAAARANRDQGTVKLLVTVEANGLPSSVTVLASSGSGTLDNAARDQISRRWRWPAGETRRYIVPVKFVLQP
jgi:protein TonB